ncbi:MAG: MFS transporter, partial [Alphaproteobacteria bacterium]
MQANSKNALIIYCGLLSAVGAVSIDILMPVFGNMRAGFGVSMESVQLTIPVYTFFLGISQFFMGTLSDRFGRRIIIIYGMSLYVIGGFIAILYPSIEMVLFGRAIQGIGGGCGQVIARAMLRDTCSGREYSIALARVIAIFAIGPIIAPLIGAGLNMGDTWRPAFAFMIVFGLGLLAYSLFSLKETMVAKNFDALKISAMKDNFLVLVRDKKVLHLLLIGCSAKIALFSYLVNGAPVFEAEFEVVKMNFALLF